VAQLTLIGNVAQDAEIKVSRKDQEFALYVSTVSVSILFECRRRYTVVTNNNINQDGGEQAT